MWYLIRLVFFLLRPTKLRLGAWVILGLVTYLLFLTPEKRAVRHRLAEADEQSQAALDNRARPLTELINRGRDGAKGFAKEVLSLSGKWALVKGAVVTGAHRQFLQEAWARHVFSPDELKSVLEAVCRNYADDLDGIESQMLVRLRADLADPDRPPQEIAPHLRNNDAFAAEYRRLTAVVAADLQLDLGVVVGRELVLLVATDIASRAALQAARAAAAEMGIQAAVLGTGAGSTVATLGIGLVIGFIMDAVLDELFKMAGYDAEQKIESAVKESLDTLWVTLLANPGLERHLGVGKKGALRVELEKIHESRSKLRRGVVDRMLKGDGK